MLFQTAVVSVLQPYGYNDSGTISPSLWFTVQNVTAQLSLVTTICANQDFATISRVFDALTTSLQSGPMKDTMDICSNSARLSALSFDATNRNWFYSQNVTIQKYAIQRICKDWTVMWPPNVLRTYALLAVKSPTQLVNEIFDGMNQCPVAADFIHTLNSQLYMYVAFSLFTAVLLGVFLCFVLVYAEPSTRWSRTSILSPFNVAFFIGLVSLLFIDVAYALNMDQAFKDIYSTYTLNGDVWHSSNTKRGSLFAIAQILTAIWQMSYLCFSWRRSETQIKEIYPRSHKYLLIALYASLLCILSPIPLAVAQIIQPYSNYATFNLTFQATGASALIALDLVFISSFVRYLHRNRISQTVEPLFLSVSQFGLAMTIPCICSAIISIITAMNSSMDFNSMILYTGVMVAMMHFVMLMMVCLKVTLYRQAIADYSSRSKTAHTDEKSVRKEARQARESKVMSFKEEENYDDDEERYGFVARFVHC